MSTASVSTTLIFRHARAMGRNAVSSSFSAVQRTRAVAMSVHESASFCAKWWWQWC